MGVLHRPGKPHDNPKRTLHTYPCTVSCILARCASLPLAWQAKCCCGVPQVPFQGLTIGQVYSRVVHSGARPPLDAFDAAKERSAEERPSLAAYTALLVACWAAEPSSRPRFKQVHVLC